MSKFKITEAKCFKEVATVIGPRDAERELFVASQSVVRFREKESLFDAFTWQSSKQGHDFWLSICCGDNPYDQ